MVVYCHRDVDITTILFRRLIATLDKIEFSEQSIWIQHRLTAILHTQHNNGFYFDGRRALQFYTDLREKENDLAEEIRRAFPAERVIVASRPMRKKDGTVDRKSVVMGKRVSVRENRGGSRIIKTKNKKET